MHVPDPVPQLLARHPSAELVRAWRPGVPGIAEVLHATFVGHVYPAHTHDTWALLVVDAGAVRFDLDRFEHGAIQSRVTLLPPHVAHTGRAGTEAGFRKRVLYLDATVLPGDLAGPAVDTPGLTDPVLRHRVGRLHDALASGEPLEAESRLAFIRSRLGEHLGRRPAAALGRVAGRRLADELRQLLDSRLAEQVTLRAAGALLHAHPDHLVRAFTAAFGLPPHRYLTGRRIDAARRLLLAGHLPADVAVAVGFHDQAHLTRHFARLLGTTPGRYASSAACCTRRR